MLARAKPGRVGNNAGGRSVARLARSSLGDFGFDVAARAPCGEKDPAGTAKAGP